MRGRGHALGTDELKTVSKKRDVLAQVIDLVRELLEGDVRDKGHLLSHLCADKRARVWKDEDKAREVKSSLARNVCRPAGRYVVERRTMAAAPPRNGAAPRPPHLG